MIEDIRNARGERLDVAFTPSSAANRPEIAVIGHGVTGNKDRPWALTLADALTARGIASLRVSFAGNGESEGDFGDATVSKEAEDLGAVLDAVAAAGFTDVCYVGHSMGAAVGVLRAHDDARIRRLVSLGGMVHTAEFCDRKFGDLEPDRDVMWELPDCPLSSTFVDDMHRIGSLLERGAALAIPWLLVHGTADEVVFPRDSRDIAARAADATLVELDGVDHVFTGDGAKQMAAVVTDWLAP